MKQQNLKNTVQPEVAVPTDIGKIKLFFIMIFFFIAFGAVAGKLFYIQIIKGKEYSDQARKQYEAKIPLAANRGNMYDRNNKLIASTMQKLSVAADPNSLENPAKIALLLSALTGKPTTFYREKIASSSTSFVWLERALEKAEFSPLDTLHDAGLIRAREPRRHFPYGSLASQVLGFADIDNKGVSGIELSWDSVLHGSNGMMIVQKDGRGKRRPSPDLPVSPPKHGNSLTLTLDMDIQSIVESELLQGVQNAEAESGTVIAIRPATGEILAMASVPSYNPNDPSTATPSATRLRSITDMYEPGSTFKLVLASALLEEGKIKPTDTVNGRNGSYQIKDHVIVDAHPLGEVTFREAIEESSNIVFASLAPRLSNDKFYKYVRDFGFGISTGIDIPGEVRGIVKKPREFDAMTKYFMSYGYELGATALQIVNSYATIANGGVMMKPYLIQKISDENGETVQTFEPQKIRRVVSETTAKTLTDMLVGVVDRGTGSAAKAQGVRIAGKTGTAQQLAGGKYSKQDYTASFVGFFPADLPEIAMIVMLNKPRKGYYGGQVSAPIFSAIAKRLISSGFVTVPKEQVLSQKLSPQEVAAQLITVPDFRGLTFANARDLAQQHGLRLKSEKNEGIIEEQNPFSGEQVKRDSEVQIFMRASATKTDSATTAHLPVLPDVRGMTLRRALNLLHAANIKTQVVGSGKVLNQRWIKGKDNTCILECER